MSLPRRAARAMLAASFISGGLDQIRNPQPKVGGAQPIAGPIAERVPQLPNDPESLVRLDGAIKVAGGLGLVFGPFARPAALLLAGSLVPTTLAGHRFWETADPDQKTSDRIEFFKNVSLAGGLLATALDTGGRPSVPWVANKAAHTAAETVGDGVGTVGSAVAGAAGALGGAVATGAGRARGKGSRKARAKAAKQARKASRKATGRAREAALTARGAGLGAALAGAGAAKGAAGSARGMLAQTAGVAKDKAAEGAGVARGAASSGVGAAKESAKTALRGKRRGPFGLRKPKSRVDQARDLGRGLAKDASHVARDSAKAARESAASAKDRVAELVSR